MPRLRRHIAWVLVLVLVAAAACSRGGRVIPRGELAEIYAEMYLVDEWINENPAMKRTADTSLVYGPVFARHGYTTDDYLASARHYMRDPERYAKILKKSATILDKQASALRKELELAEAQARRHHPDLWEEVDFMQLKYPFDSLVHPAADTTLAVPADSLAALPDSLGLLPADTLGASLPDMPAVPERVARKWKKMQLDIEDEANSSQVPLSADRH